MPSKTKPKAVPRTQRADERFAAALERIAGVMEKEQYQREEFTRAVMPTFRKVLEKVAA